MSAEVVLRGHKVARGKAEGEALVTRTSISFFGGVNPETGLVTDKNHELYGQSIAGKVLVFPDEKGSSGGAYQLYEMVHCGTAPRGIINRIAGPNITVGAIVSDIPMMDKLTPDPFDAIRTGDTVVIDADAGTVTLRKRKEE
jgi:uncharacterized protein